MCDTEPKQNLSVDRGDIHAPRPLRTKRACQQARFGV